MDTDTLWDEETPSNAAPAAEANGNGEDRGPGGLTMEHLGQFSQQMEERTGQMVQAMADKLAEQFGQALSRLEQNLKPEPEPANPEELSARMFSEPREAMTEIADERISQSLAQQVMPAVLPAIQALHKLNVANQRTEVDRKFGSGAFETVIAKDLDSIMDTIRQNNPTQLGDEQTLQRAVSMVVGQKVDALLEHRMTAEKTREEQEKKEMDGLTRKITTNLSGGHFRPEPAGGGLSEDAKEFIALQASSGHTVDPKSLSVALSSGNSLREYRQARQKIKGEA